ncbi:MAG: glycosyltransferase [Chloroflexi bacterium]|nr:glycosyltransferase [Chloroflexota bacterium]
MRRVVIVDDGSEDNTPDLLGVLQESNPSIRAARLEPNRGKGAAVSHGLSLARGSLVMCMDADLATPLDQLNVLLRRIETGADMAIGSRGLPDSVLEQRENLLREWSGRLYNQMVQRLLTPGIWDTQCGFKLFRGPVARALAPSLIETRYAFDVEMVYLARLCGFSLSEAPVRWRHQPGSRVRLLHDGASMLAGLWRIWRRKHAGLYHTSVSAILDRYHREGERTSAAEWYHPPDHPGPPFPGKHDPGDTGR